MQSLGQSCSEGLVPWDDEQMISPEIAVPQIPRPEAEQLCIPQVKAGLDLPAVLRWRDFNTFSRSSGLSLPHREKQITNLRRLPPGSLCPAGRYRLQTARAGLCAAASPCLLLAAQLPPLCLLCTFTPRSLSSHYTR